MSSLTIKDCKILDNGQLVDSNIFINNGIIKKIGEYTKADEEINAESKIVIPGIIDPHVHFREPGFTHKEDFLTGSMAAAKGGITTYIDMPNTQPPTTTVINLEEKRKMALKSVVNYGFHFGATSNNLEQIRKASNIASVKVFMNTSTGKLMIKAPEILKKVFSSFPIITVHAEKEKVVEAIKYNRLTGNRLYLCHISSREEILFLRKNKTAGIYIEVTPHHLFLNSGDNKDGYTSMKPNLKSKIDQDELWKSISDGTIDTIGTDHAPHTKEEKEGEEEVYGVPGAETMLPLLLDAVNKNRINLQKLVELCCENPAKIFGITNKGKIVEGYDADLVIIDMELEKEIINEDMLSKCGWTPFNGKKAKGWPVITIVNGKVVYRNNEITNKTSGREVFFNGK